MTRGTIAGALAFGMALGSTAHGAEPTDVRLDYEAPAECPDRQAFVDQVTARTDLVHITEPATVRWSVVLNAEGSRHVGKLRVVDAEGTESVRTIRAATCDEVVSAVALVAALSVDPDARSEPKATPRRSAPVPEPRSAASPPAKSPPAGWHRVHWGFGEHAQWQTGVVPGGGASLRLFAGIGWGDGGPSFRLSAARTSPSIVPTAEGRGEISWWAARVELSPVAWIASRSLVVVPSAGIEAGALHAEGLDVDVTRATTRPWVSVEVGLRLEVPVYGAFRLECQGVALTPLVRDRFWIGRSTTVFRSPAVGAFGAIGVAVQFP
jgi:hypothetical protein